MEGDMDVSLKTTASLDQLIEMLVLSLGMKIFLLNIDGVSPDIIINYFSEYNL